MFRSLGTEIHTSPTNRYIISFLTMFLLESLDNTIILNKKHETINLAPQATVCSLVQEIQITHSLSHSLTHSLTHSPLSPPTHQRPLSRPIGLATCSKLPWPRSTRESADDDATPVELTSRVRYSSSSHALEELGGSVLVWVAVSACSEWVREWVCVLVLVAWGVRKSAARTLWSAVSC